MRSKSKLVLKARIVKHIIEYYELDCTGMDMDEVKDEMEIAYVEDRDNWEYQYTESDGSEIDIELEIVNA